MTDHVAIIAGAGRFPFNLAREAKRSGVRVSAIGLKGWVDASLEAEVDDYIELPVGALGSLIRHLVERDISHVIMAGKVTKAVLFDPATTFDAETIALLANVKENSVNGLLGAIAEKLAERDIRLLDSSIYMKAAICPEGVLSERKPTAAEKTDIHFGVDVARHVSEMDIGQTVVVRNRVVIAVEAFEGTDAAIRRAGQLAHGQLVAVKTGSSQQDRRFDLPCVGPDTIATLAQAGVSCLALEAGSALLLDKEKLIEDVNAHGIALVGVGIHERS